MNPLDAQESIRVSTALLGIYGLVAGCAMFLWVEITDSINDRYAPIVDAPGSLTLWGPVATLLGLVIVVGVIRGNKRTTAAALFIGGIWNLAVAAGFAVSFIDRPEITPISFVAMSLIGIAHCEKAFLLWSSRNVRLVALSGIATVSPEGEERGDGAERTLGSDQQRGP